MAQAEALAHWRGAGEGALWGRKKAKDSLKAVTWDTCNTCNTSILKMEGRSCPKR
jgi:hypothetical protein